MTRQLDELRHWMSSLEPRMRLFENQPSEAEHEAPETSENNDRKA